jgi:hypothetical protein
MIDCESFPLWPNPPPDLSQPNQAGCLLICSSSAIRIRWHSITRGHLDASQIAPFIPKLSTKRKNMSSSSEGFATLRFWQSLAKRVRLFSLGTVSYIPEGAEVRIRSVGFDKHSERNVVIDIQGASPPLTPSFNLTGAQFSVLDPESIPEDFPLSDADIARYSLYVWIDLRDKTILLFAESESD